MQSPFPWFNLKNMNILPSPTLLIYFKEYEESHRNSWNKHCHTLGLPLVMFSVLGLLSHVVVWAPLPTANVPTPLFQFDFGFLLFLVGAIFSIKMDFKLSIPYLMMAYLMYLLSRQVPLLPLVILQGLGWGFQFLGHYKFEKKSPAFFKSLEHLFVGPMWLFARAIRYY